MFDKFEPFLRLEKQNFNFKPNRYETWMNGQIISSGLTTAVIVARSNNQDGEEKMEILFDSPTLDKELASKNIYDEFITSGDRLQLITIPEQTNVENRGIMMFKMNLGATRLHKDFNNNESYCCNLFLHKGTIAKITFAFSNPEKLIEFYNDSIIDYSNQSVDVIGFHLWNDFQKFRKKILNLPLPMRFSCDVYGLDNKKIINNEKGHFHFEAEQVFLRTDDESGDYIRLYNNNGEFFCEYVVMNGQTIVHQEVGSIEINSKGLPYIEVKYQKDE